MRRRQFIAGLGSTAAWPVVARAQQGALPVVGFVGIESARDASPEGFRKGLSETSYVEGQKGPVRQECLQGFRCRPPGWRSSMALPRPGYRRDQVRAHLVVGGTGQPVALVRRVWRANVSRDLHDFDCASSGRSAMVVCLPCDGKRWKALSP
jgi:hypothetical protein